MKPQAIRNSDIMTEFDRHARGRFALGVLVGVSTAAVVMFIALFTAGYLWI